MKKPQVSIVIPTFNRASFLSYAIDSVLAQNFSDYELLIVDDGSCDNTQAVLDKYGKRIKVLKKANGGVSSARNFGIIHSTGDYIAFLDSDDYWEKNKLKAQVDFFTQNDAYKIAQTEEIWLKNGELLKPEKKHKKKGGYIFKECLSMCLISPSAVMIKRELFDEVGLFDEKFPVCEDYDLWLRISANYPVGLIDEYLTIKVGGHDDQLSRTYKHLDCYRVIALEKVLKKIKTDENKRALVINELIKKIKIILKGLNKADGEEYKYYNEKLQLMV